MSSLSLVCQNLHLLWLWLLVLDQDGSHGWLDQGRCGPIEDRNLVIILLLLKLLGLLKFLVDCLQGVHIVLNLSHFVLSLQLIELLLLLLGLLLLLLGLLCLELGYAHG